MVAKRGADGEWIKISYAQMLDRVRRIGQALAQRPLSAERPIAILSDNDLEHYTLALAAQWVGVPYTPVSVAYSTVSQDFAKLKQILGTLTPGLVFAADGHVFRNAIATCVPADVEVLLTQRRGHARAAGPARDALRLAAQHRARRRRSARRMPRSGRTRSPSSCSPPARPNSPRA